MTDASAAILSHPNNSLTPEQIVAELDQHIVGQQAAKKAVAIALRNRWRRLQLAPDLRDEVLPKNILMIGPTGVGKTEIARRLAKLADAPFIKVEATKFTEIGYVGRDVEQIIRDLVEISIHQTKAARRLNVMSKAYQHAEERVLDVLVGTSASVETREKFRKRLVAGELNETEIEIDVPDNSSLSMPTIDVPGMPGASMGMLNLGDVFGKAMGGQRKKRRLATSAALKILIEEEADKLLDQDSILQQAIARVESAGIVFIDEIDKITSRDDHRGGDVSREGVQRDLLPLIEGTTVNTKHGSVKTDHILFITSGAFHVAKPSDLLPELQGRLPIRVELLPLKRADFARILVEPKASLIKQYIALLSTEGVDLSFTDAAITRLAQLAEDINARVENIGARRLHALLEKLLEDLSFHAPHKRGESVVIDVKDVDAALADLSQSVDLSRFIL